MGRRRVNPFKCGIRRDRSATRHFRPRDLGRVACAVRENGYTLDAMLAELEKCAPCERQRRRRRADARVLARLAENSSALAEFETFLQVFDVAVEGLLLLTRFVPQLRSTALPVTLLKRTVAARITRLRRERAANDELYDDLSREIMREAA